MKITNEIKEKLAVKVGNELSKLGTTATRTCVFIGFYEPKVSIDLLKQNSK